MVADCVGAVVPLLVYVFDRCLGCVRSREPVPCTLFKKRKEEGT